MVVVVVSAVVVVVAAGGNGDNGSRNGGGGSSSEEGTSLAGACFVGAEAGPVPDVKTALVVAVATANNLAGKR